MGRHALPVGTKLERGTYRPERDGAVPDGAAGVPKCPRHLKGEARAFWKRVVPDLISRGMARAIDAPALELLCEAWSLCQAALKEAAKDPTDRAARGAVNTYMTQFQVYSKRFGLTYGDRQKLRTPPVPEDDGVATRPRIATGTGG